MEKEKNITFEMRKIYFCACLLYSLSRAIKQAQKSGH